MSFKKIVFAAVGAVMAASAANAADKITITTEGAWPPFNFKNDKGELVGYEVELAAALCEKMGVECEIVGNDWDGLIPGLIARKWDAIMGDMSITEERLQKINFSDPYHKTPAVWVVPKSWTGDVNEASLDGKTIGTQESTIFSAYIEDTYPALDLKTYGKQDEVQLDLTADRIDLFMADQIVSQRFLDSDAGKDYKSIIVPHSKKHFGVGAGVGLRKGDDKLEAMFNKAITEVIADGTMDALWKEWFGFGYVEPASRK